LKLLLKDWQGTQGRPVYLPDVLNILLELGLVEDIRNDKDEIIGVQLVKKECCKDKKS
jgi:metal-sulfur cluster biosynthetic enzyme